MLLILNIIFIFDIKAQQESLEIYQSKIISDSAISLDLIEYGITKQQNIYDYHFNLNYKTENFINFQITQFYNGNTFLSTEKLSKDDEFFKINLDKQLINNLNIISQTNYILINYPGNNELSKIERLNSLFGFVFDNKKNVSLKLLAGPESNSQIGYSSVGFNYRINSNLNNLYFEEYLINFKNDIELLTLDRDRFNKDILVYTNIMKEFDAFDRLQFDLRYKLLDRYNLSKRDSLYMINNLLDFEYSIENRLSNTYNSNLLFDFLLFDKLSSNFNLVYDYSNVSKSFNQYIQKDSRTGIIQSREFQKLFLDFKVEYNGAINQKLSFSYDIENENNYVLNKNNIINNEFRKYENLVFDLNFEQSIFKIMSITSFKVNSKDSIELGYSSTIKRFDTPSLTNNSDRDELLSIISFNYYNKLNKAFELSFNTELQLYHQVNLKASLSGSNYWMRTIKLGPQFIYKTINFYMRPNISILANYVAYDFEEQTQNIKSYSIRQIAYNDSLDYKLGNKFSLSAKLDIIYKETGILYWNDFEELPINGNLRFFSKLLISNYSDNYNSSVGIRYYNLSLNNFANIGGNYANLSYGPEVSFTINFDENSKLEFNGWYEFQVVNNTLIGEIPNFFIKSSIIL